MDGERISLELSADFEADCVRDVIAARLFGESRAPPRIGRYVVLERVGSGGMGVVFAAFDERLDRRVAIKLLHREHDSLALRQRLRREAQAMARVTHENVAQIYEIGEHGEQGFVVMEFVDGCSLRQWQSEQAPTWSDIVEHYSAAGRGLAAAHERGMVHRDFKPDNALLGNDGRVRVVDFGLARADGATTLEQSGDAFPDIDALAVTMTRTGALAGTPAYMPPEQLRGERAGPAADQFAFCVALFEALHGRRPFAGETARALYEAVCAGRIEAPSGSHRVPAYLGNVLARGLAADPRARWPSMQALLAAIARDPARRRRRIIRVAAASGVVLTALVGVRVVEDVRHRRAIAACEARGDLGALWNDDVERRVAAALGATSVDYAAATIERIGPALDDYARRLSESEVEACFATQVEHRASADALDRTQWCLDERKLALGALVQQLELADAETIGRAVSAVATLPRVDTCTDAALLERLPPPPVGQREAIDAVRGQIARGDALLHAGRHTDGLDEAAASLAAAESLQWPPLSAAARDLFGRALQKSGRYPEAERELSHAYYEAMEAGAFEIAANASTELVHTVGVQLARRADGIVWSRHAESALALLGDDDGLGTARLLARRAELHTAMVELDEARQVAERALAIRERELGADHPDVGETAYLIALALQLRDAEAAQPYAKRAVAIAETTLGPDHPDLVPRLELLASVGGAEVLPTIERALRIGERALGPDHPIVASALVVQGRQLYWTVGADAARPIVQRALAIQEAKLDPRHPDIARTVNLLGLISHPRPEAVPYYQRALAIAEEHLGPWHPFVAPPLYNLAEIHELAGEYEQAIDAMERAVAVRKKVFGADSGYYAGYLSKLAEIETCAGHEARVREIYGEILRVDAAHPSPDHGPIWVHVLAARAAVADGDPVAAHASLRLARAAADHCEKGTEEYAPLAELADFVLAQALWELPADAGRDRGRARRLARAVAGRLARADARVPDVPCWTIETERAKVTRWLATHDRE